jgi:NAD-dependent deacetylase
MFSPELPEDLLLKFGQSRSLCVLTGAGISLISGVPTFQGSGRLQHFNNYPCDYLSSTTAWQDYPEIVKAFYDDLRNRIYRARPSITHQTLHGWEQRRFTYPLKFFLLTLNFDGLHHLMGNESVIELQGTIWQLRCNFCQTIYDLVPFRQLPMPEYCEICQGFLRPNIVFNDEPITRAVHRQAISAIEESDTFISIGVSGQVAYSNQLINLARRKCTFLIEINPQPTVLSKFFDISILGRAEEVVPQFYWDYFFDMF